MTIRRLSLRHWVVLIGMIAAVAAATTAAPRWLPFMAVIESWIADLRVALLAPAAVPNEDVVLLVIDEETLAKLPYRSPIDRGLLADLLGVLGKAGVRAVGIDILFDRPTEPAKDAALQKAMAEFPAPLVLAWADTAAGLTPRQEAYLEAFTAPAQRARVDIIVDRRDGTVRSIYPGRQGPDGFEPSFAAALATLAGASPPREKVPFHFQRRPRSGDPPFATYPAHTAHLLPPAWLKDKIVLIGQDLDDIDRFRTPFAAALRDDGRVAGVVIHATALVQFLEDRSLEEFGLAGELGLVLALVLLGVALTLLDLPLGARISGLAIVTGVVWVGGFAHYAQEGPLLNLFSPTLGMFAAAGLTNALAEIRERAQRQLARAMEEERDRAEAANRAKSSFLATMSHEIRTPMNGVVGMIDLLDNTDLSTDQRQMTTTIRDSAFTLLRVIDDILDFSKIEAGRIQLENIPVSVRDILEGIGDALAPNAERDGIRLQLRIDPLLPSRVMGDQVRLRQILFNLVGNAIKFTSSDDRELGRVSIAARRRDAGEDGKVVLEFSVEDNGIGMDEGQLAELFTAFGQGEVSTTRRFGGTGLGLSICRDLTRLMGGEISAESSPGAGSTFTVRIPFDIAPGKSDEDDMADLAGVRLAVSLADEELAETVRSYLDFAGCRLTQDLAAAAPPGAEPGSEPVVLVTDEPAARPATVGTAIARVLLSEERAPNAGTSAGGTVVVSAYPLKPSALLHAVALAAGRQAAAAVGDAPMERPGVGPAPSVEAAARGEVVLVAEDNVTSQDVIRRQLHMLGYAAEMTSNGAEALATLASGRHGLLLTDCHMPVVDGYELARRVRRAEEGGEGRLPIVAITASVMEDDVRKCLEAGMDDYLAKPIEMDRLRAMLARWLPRAAASAAAAEAGGRRPDAASGAQADGGGGPAIDERALKDVFGDDPEVFREILGDFIAPARANLAEIVAACEARDAGAVGDACHKLKSSAKAVGAHELAELCVALEKAGKAADWEAIGRYSPELGGAFAKVAAYIEER